MPLYLHMDSLVRAKLTLYMEIKNNTIWDFYLDLSNSYFIKLKIKRILICILKSNAHF